MKKKIISLSLIFALSASIALAQGSKNSGTENSGSGSAQEQGNKDNGQESNVQENQSDSQESGSQENKNVTESVQAQTQTQIREQEQIQTQQQTEGSDEEIEEQTRQQNKARNMEQLKTMIQEKKQEMKQKIQEIKDKKQQFVHQNQNRVREAVHALLASEELMGGVGGRVSEIAREFNNSVEKTIQAEEKIQKRNRIVEFLFGGDKEAARNIEQEVNKNKEKLQNLKNLWQQCDCAVEVKNVIQEQIQNIEQEQSRLSQLAQEQKSKKGLFGWLFGWMGE